MDGKSGGMDNLVFEDSSGYMVSVEKRETIRPLDVGTGDEIHLQLGKITLVAVVLCVENEGEESTVPRSERRWDGYWMKSVLYPMSLGTYVDSRPIANLRNHQIDEGHPLTYARLGEIEFSDTNHAVEAEHIKNRYVKKGSLWLVRKSIP